ncbi:unnamed protein product, partial [Didymodactylos carnosus]
DTLNPPPVSLWHTDDVEKWMKINNLTEYIDKFCNENEIDGLTLLLMKEEDLKTRPLSIVSLKDIKRLWYHIRLLQCSEANFYNPLTIPNEYYEKVNSTPVSQSKSDLTNHNRENHSELAPSILLSAKTHSYQTKPNPRVYCTMCRGEKRKTFFSFLYAFMSCLWTSYIMAVVHDRVPNTTKYPPLPDIFLDNIPFISWAFSATEYLIFLLGIAFLLILCFHKYWTVILRRFFALSGTIFLLRSITMLVTSLSVPGPHLECTPFKYGTFRERFLRGLEIFLFQGDYMFSGHTVMLTLLNHCITEYTTSDFYVIHLISWICNIFGMFLILAAHEHYTIDVFIAFFLTSRLFLYYHSLANNLALTQKDTRLSIWFPMFSYFEKNVNGTIPNVFRIPYPFSKFLSSEDRTRENDGDENNNTTDHEAAEQTILHSNSYCDNPGCCSRKVK